MRRTNRKHTHAIERYRRTKGPELLCKAADNELQQNADLMVKGLAKSTIQDGSVAAAAMLMTMAEAAENPVAYQRTLSLAEKWSQEPPFVQVEILDGHAELTPPMKTLQLTDGNAAAAGAAAAGAAAAGDAADEKLGEVETDSDTSDVEEEDIIDAEVEDCPPTAPKSD